MANDMSTRADRDCHWSAMFGGNFLPYPSMNCLLIYSRMSPKFTSMSPTSKEVFPAKHRLSDEKFLP